jgi:alkaline phosphatase
MGQTFLVVGSMCSAVMLACTVAVLTAMPGFRKERTVTLVGAGDIARCDDRSDRAAARLLGKTRGTVFTLGDNVYPDGTRAQFRNCYGPTWGKYKKRTKPAIGNHEYGTPGASGYFGYFGKAAGKRGKGYYSYERGSWYIIALNKRGADVILSGHAHRYERYAP